MSTVRFKLKALAAELLWFIQTPDNTHLINVQPPSPQHLLFGLSPVVRIGWQPGDRGLLCHLDLPTLLGHLLGDEVSRNYL